MELSFRELFHRRGYGGKTSQTVICTSADVTLQPVTELQLTGVAASKQYGVLGSGSRVNGDESTTGKNDSIRMLYLPQLRELCWWSYPVANVRRGSNEAA